MSNQPSQAIAFIVDTEGEVRIENRQCTEKPVPSTQTPKDLPGDATWRRDEGSAHVALDGADDTRGTSSASRETLSGEKADSPADLPRDDKPILALPAPLTGKESRMSRPFATNGLPARGKGIAEGTACGMGCIGRPPCRIPMPCRSHLPHCHEELAHGRSLMSGGEGFRDDAPGTGSSPSQSASGGRGPLVDDIGDERLLDVAHEMHHRAGPNSPQDGPPLERDDARGRDRPSRDVKEDDVPLEHLEAMVQAWIDQERPARKLERFKGRMRGWLDRGRSAQKRPRGDCPFVDVPACGSGHTRNLDEDACGKDGEPACRVVNDLVGLLGADLPDCPGEAQEAGNAPFPQFVIPGFPSAPEEDGIEDLLPLCEFDEFACGHLRIHTLLATKSRPSGGMRLAIRELQEMVREMEAHGRVLANPSLQGSVPLSAEEGHAVRQVARAIRRQVHALKDAHDARIARCPLAAIIPAPMEEWRGDAFACGKDADAPCRLLLRFPHPGESHGDDGSPGDASATGGPPLTPASRPLPDGEGMTVGDHVRVDAAPCPHLAWFLRRPMPRKIPGWRVYYRKPYPDFDGRKTDLATSILESRGKTAGWSAEKGFFETPDGSVVVTC